MKDKSELILHSIDDWIQALKLFSKSTNLITSLYLPDGQRVAGPFTSTPFGNFLLSSGKFRGGEICNYCEGREVLKVMSSGNKITFDFARALRIDALPVKYNEEIIAVIMVGWVFDHFPDPVECEHIARSTGMSGNQCWQVARLQAPVSKDKFIIYEEMLKLLTGTMLEQISSHQKLKEAVKVKDDLLAIVSHELKTPLTSILLRIQMLKNHKVPADKINHFLDTLETNARLEAKLIDDLLDAAKMQTGKLYFEQGEFDLIEAIDSAFEMIAGPVKEKKITVKKDYPHEQLLFFGDKIRFIQAMHSLLSNSVKFSTEGGEILIQIMRNQQMLQIVLTDKGIGIEEDFLPQVFEFFRKGERQSSRIKSGLGLGLSLVKNIIEMHGGEITADSDGINQGATFTITLPNISAAEQSSPSDRQQIPRRPS